MIVKRVSIRNFRGIRKMDWDLGGNMLCLVGPNDSTKTTILHAIWFALCPKSYVTFTDDDFYEGKTDVPIQIDVTIGQVPEELLTFQKFLHYQRGWKADGGFVDDPTSGSEPVITVRLTVDKSLEPEWWVAKDSLPDGQPIGKADRAKLGATLLGEDVYRHLSWVYGSALAQGTENSGDGTSALVEAGRAAKDVVTCSSCPGLAAAAKKTQEYAVKYGVKPRTGFVPGLDLAAVRMGNGAIALYDGKVPMRLAGAGTAKLVSLAIQVQAVKEGSVILVDEIEYGLEPHRLRMLLRRLHPEDQGAVGASPAQVIFTTHSPVSLREMKREDVRIARSDNGETRISMLPEALKEVTKFFPDALLARRVIVCEGQTEIGLLRGLQPYWETQHDGVPIEQFGVALADGRGTNAEERAKAFAKLDYDVLLFGDSDTNAGTDDNALETEGIKVVRWGDKFNTEQRVCVDVAPSCLQQVFRLACEKETEESVVACIAEKLGTPSNKTIPPIEQWFKLHKEEMTTRLAIAEVANKKQWFKSPEMGEKLGNLLSSHLPTLSGKDIGKKLNEIEQWCYEQ